LQTKMEVVLLRIVVMVSEMSEVKIYRHLLVANLVLPNACEAGCVFFTCIEAPDDDQELRGPCMMTWVPMSCFPMSIRPVIPGPLSLSMNEL
jgi:hypothetical protein